VSTEKIYQAVLKIAVKSHAESPLKTHLDIGAGSGRLIQLFHENLGVRSCACDYTDTLLEVPGQKVDVVNLNHDRLPYPDGSFDVVTATEVIEHLENYREILRDIHRVLNDRGVCIVSTPNILNINSRIRYLSFGFSDLFGPLPVTDRKLHLSAGHISPISYFYLTHALLEANFSSVSLSFDKYQRSGMAKLLLLYLPIKAFGRMAFKKELSKYHGIDERNIGLVRSMNSVGMLLGRTIIVTAKKDQSSSSREKSEIHHPLR
jgi:ubiquinone/menaquinone biosynthesis C-methylase UbiE